MLLTPGAGPSAPGRAGVDRGRPGRRRRWRAPPRRRPTGPAPGTVVPGFVDAHVARRGRGVLRRRVTRGGRGTVRRAPIARTAPPRWWPAWSPTPLERLEASVRALAAAGRGRLSWPASTSRARGSARAHCRRARPGAADARPTRPRSTRLLDAGAGPRADGDPGARAARRARRGGPARRPRRRRRDRAHRRDVRRGAGRARRRRDGRAPTCSTRCAACTTASPARCAALARGPATRTSS